MARTLPPHKITLRNIQKYWNNPELSNLSIEEFCTCIFPDVYNPKLTRSPNSQQLLNQRNTTSSSFFGGNYPKGNGTEFGFASLTMDFLKHLRSDEPMEYLAENRGKTTSLQSMLSHVHYWVIKTNPRFTPTHHFFCTFDFSEIDQEVIDAIGFLLENGAPFSVSYAVFLVILIAIFQTNITMLKDFYDDNALKQVLETHPFLEEQLQKPLLNDCNHFVPLTDPHYMNHDYNLLMYKPGYDELYNSAVLSIRMDEHNQPEATISLENIINTPGTRNKAKQRIFKGVPVLSTEKSFVYIVFYGVTDNCKGQLLSLWFHYDFFPDAEMYFRTALLMSYHGKRDIPQVQKVAIVEKDMDKKDMAFIKGTLKMSDTNILITKEQLDAFLEEFSTESWMPLFKEKFLPMILHHKQECYLFKESLIIDGDKLSGLAETELLKIAYSLKEKSEGVTFVDCAAPKNLHKLFK